MLTYAKKMCQRASPPYIALLSDTPYSDWHTFHTSERLICIIARCRRFCRFPISADKAYQDRLQETLQPARNFSLNKNYFIKFFSGIDFFISNKELWVSHQWDLDLWSVFSSISTKIFLSDQQIVRWIFSSQFFWPFRVDFSQHRLLHTFVIWSIVSIDLTSQELQAKI